MGAGSILPRTLCLIKILILVGIAEICLGYPLTLDDYRFVDRELSSLDAHQLASWLTSQLRKSDDISPMQDNSITSYRLPLQDKRNSEATSTLIGTKIIQRMLKEGKK